MMLNGGTYDGVRIVADSTVRLFTTRASGNRALGLGGGRWAVGRGQLSQRQRYGHTGFTGTSIWIDPTREMFVILLTNRVHAEARGSGEGDRRRARRSRRRGRPRRDRRSGPSLAMPVSFRSDLRLGWNRARRAGIHAPRHAHGRRRGSRARARRPRPRPCPRPRAQTVATAVEVTAPTDGTQPGRRRHRGPDPARAAPREGSRAESQHHRHRTGLRHHVTGGDVVIDMSLTSPGCPSGPEIMTGAEDAARAWRA